MRPGLLDIELDMQPSFPDSRGMWHQRATPRRRQAQRCGSATACGQVSQKLPASSRLWASGITRSWIGGRAEMLHDQGSGAISTSLAARLSWEVYAGGTSAGAGVERPTAGAYAVGGTVGIGPYLEAGVRQGARGHTEMLITGGVSMRLPAIAALGAVFQLGAP
jgi:hypothetical protein